jgi:tetratricopeptide (TPR) repeat protein
VELRKEVILFLATLGILVLMFVTGAQDPLPARLPRSKPAEFVPPQLPPSAVVREDAPAIERGARDLFLKPSATRPLPPLELELPTMQPLPVQLPAIQPGPVLAKGYLQRVVLTELPTEPTASSATSGGGAGEGMGESSSEPATGGSGEEEPRSAVPAIAAGSTQAVEEADYSDEYDRITLTNGRQIWGQTRGEDPYAYGQPDEADVWALTGPFRKAVSFQTYRPEKGTAGITNPWPAGDVQRVEFAKRIGNKIALMQRRIPEDDTGLSQRTAFVLDLLENYRDVEDALVEAEKQAKRHIELAPSNASGYELLAFVYHATGQYEKELEFYDGLANGEFAGAAFVHVGRAAVARKLGMDELAREELMRATQVDSGYARGWLMLAQIALDAGSSAEAVDFAQRAVSRRAPGAPKRISLEIDRIYVQALIADAQLPGSADTARRARESRPRTRCPLQLAELRMLRGAVELGLGKVRPSQGELRGGGHRATRAVPRPRSAPASPRSDAWGPSRRQVARRIGGRA